MAAVKNIYQASRRVTQVGGEPVYKNTVPYLTEVQQQQQQPCCSAVTVF